MKVSVTQDHIDRGLRHSAGFCPIALAMNEQHGPGHLVATCESLFTNEDGVVAWLKMPSEADDFIGKFDTGEPVQPFEFEVTPC